MHTHLRKFLEQSDHARKHTPGINNPRDVDQHIDGFGLAWFHPVRRNWTTMRSTSVYSALPNINDIVNGVGVIVGHLRNADTESSVAMENTHPFRYANHIFVHNGTITGYRDNREVIMNRILSEFKPRIKGDTDTELLFYLFLSECEKRTEPGSARRLVAALKETMAFLQLHFPEITANIVYANTNYTLITRYRYSRNNTPGQAPSLYWNGAYEQTPRKILISSEPLLDETFIIGENQYIVVRHNGYEPVYCGKL